MLPPAQFYTKVTGTAPAGADGHLDVPPGTLSTSNPNRSRPMKAAYWITTALLALLLLSTGSLDITHQPMMVAGVTSLGYPEYFLTLDGVAKGAAVAGILVPGLVVAREWAYAGLTFLTLGAAWSHLACHQSPVPPLVLLALVQASCLLWRRSRGEGAAKGPRSYPQGS
jgi:hypothetical protein